MSSILAMPFDVLLPALSLFFPVFLLGFLLLCCKELNFVPSDIKNRKQVTY